MWRLAESYRDRGDFVEALRIHKASVRHSPNSLSYRSWVAWTYADLEMFEAAERWYRGVLSLDPGFMYALQMMADMYVYDGRPDSAVHYAEQAVSLYPDEALPRAIAAMVGHYLRDFERTERHAGKIVATFPGVPVRAIQTHLATTMLGFALLRSEGSSVRSEMLFEESLEFLEAMVAAGADTPRWPYEIALIHAARGDAERAIGWLETAFDRGFRWTRMLELDPMLDSIREDARLQDLVARMRADVAEMRQRVELEMAEADS